MLTLENYYSGDYNTENENELSSQQIERIKKLLLDAIELYPLEIGNSNLKTNNLNDVLNKRKNTIYSTLKPFEIQKSKLIECIERLDKIIAITQNQKLNLLEKLEKIEKCEKTVLFDLLIGKQQNQNADGIPLIKSNINSLDDKKWNNNSRNGNKLKTISSAAPMIRSQSVTIVKKNNKFNLNKANTKNIISPKSFEKLSSKKDDISNPIKTKLLNRNNKLKTIEKDNNNDPNKKSINNINSSSFIENIPFNENIKKPKTIQTKYLDIKMLVENKTLKASQVFPLKRNRTSSINIEKPIISSRINSTIQTTEKPPICSGKQELECSSSVSSEINVSQIIIKNEKSREINKDLEIETKTLLENNHTQNPSKIPKDDFEDNDLVQKILTKFDSVKQFIERYKKQHTREIQNSNFNHKGDNKRYFKDEFITEWITANRNSGNQISSNQNLENNKNQSIKSNSSISGYHQSICNLVIPDKERMLNVNKENLQLKIVVCEDNDLFEFEKQQNETLKNYEMKNI